MNKINKNSNNNYKKNNNNINSTNNSNINGKKINNKYNYNIDTNNGKEDSVKTEELVTLKDILDGQKNNINKKNNNLVTDYNKYDLDDMLNLEEDKNIYNKNNYNKNSVNKYSKQTKKSVLKDSGQNIVYGINNRNNKTKENNKNLNEDKYNFNDDELNDINYDELDYDLNEGGSSNKNNDNNKTTNPKISKLKTVTTPYERLELLNQLEMENKKETEELLEKMAKNQNLSQNSEDI